MVYYAPKQPDEASIERKEAILARIDFWHTTMLYLGTRKIAAKLQEEGYDAGRKLVRSYSDQGRQFTSEDYKQLLREHHIRQSMDGKSRWADNPLCGRLPKLGLTDCGSGCSQSQNGRNMFTMFFCCVVLTRGPL